jgi:isochorismate synthase EntC
MTERSDLSALLTGEQRVYGLMEPGQNLRLRWGEDGETPESLYFRKFHSPRTKSPSAWEAFDDAALWSPVRSRVLAPRMIENVAPPARPAAAAHAPRADWDKLCSTADSLLKNETANKLVPAREVSYAITPKEHGAILAAIGPRLFAPAVQNAYRFVIKSRGAVFFGATPELLFHREHGQINVPAIAGTQPLIAGADTAELGRELFASQKDRIEHQWVVSGILESLRGISLNPKAPAEPVIMEVPRLLHLLTPITAEDKRGLSGDRVLTALHPTAAIGGHPRGRATHFLYENETFDRGLFSAPLLFQSGSRQLCLVAIRSALLTPNRLHFFAGAGYVNGSTAEGEWRETEKKMQVMQTMLFGEGA